MQSPGFLSLRVANYFWPTTLGPDFSKKENGTLDVISIIWRQKTYRLLL